MKREGCFYVIGAGDTYFRKVGICNSNLMVRIHDLQTGNPLRLQYMLIIQFPLPELAASLEASSLGWIGSQKSSRPCLGEWSYIEQPDSKFIEQLLLMSHTSGVPLVNYPRAIIT